MFRRDVLYLCGLTIVLGYTAFARGGFTRPELNYSLLALGLLTVFYWARSRRAEPVSAMGRWLFWPLLLLPCYVIFQFVPLPVPLVKLLSPARAEQIEGLRAIVPDLATASLSLMPGATVAHFFRIAAYILVLLTVRDITLRRAGRPWAAAIPVIVVGALEAVIGLLQYWEGVTKPRMAFGTYPNHSHYANLLAMALPFAIMYAVVLARRERSPDSSPGLSLFFGCILLAVAPAIFLAIVFSLSGSGFISCMASLLFMGVLCVSRRVGVGWRWAAASAVVILVIVGFVILPPDPVVDRFAGELQLGEGSRPRLWEQTLTLAPYYPLFGCGLGAYEAALYPHQNLMHEKTIDYAHNDYLQLLVELGAAGFLMGALLFAAVVRSAVRAALRGPGSEEGALAIACAGALAACLTHAFYNFNFYAPANSLMAAIICAITLSSNDD